MDRKTYTADSLKSLVSGMGNPNFDKASSAFYADTVLTDDALVTGYRNSWMIGKIVDIPATDAVRKGREWQAEKDEIAALKREEKRLNLWAKLRECKIKARLYGGAAILIGIKGEQDYSQEMNLDTIGRGDLSYLTVMTRRELVAGELETNGASEFYGRPKFYTFSNGTTEMVIHPSRIIRMVGIEHPDPFIAGGLNHGWGDSVLQRVYDACLNADSTSANIASLVFEANVDVFGVPDLMSMLDDPEYEKRLLTRMRLASVSKSNSKALIRDTEEEYSRNTINFTGLPDVLKTFLLVVSGASYIPLTRFLGQSPSGLSSTGEGDEKNYDEFIDAGRTLELAPEMYRFDEALIRSSLGHRPDEIFYNWAPLTDVSEKDRAEIGLKNSQAAEVIARTGLFGSDELREAVSNQMIESGFYPGFGEIMSDDSDDGDMLEGDVLPPDFASTGGDKPQELALNGAQVASMIQIAQAVAGGLLPTETANGMIAAAFPALSAEQVSSILSPLAGFTPAALVTDTTPVTDATPRTLYIRRDILNANEIVKWYREQGVKSVYEADSMHTTIIYSKTPVDWMKFNQSWQGSVDIPPGGPRLHELFGDDRSILVLLYTSSELEWRNAEAIELGATSSHPEYQPHISITLEGSSVNLATLKPWQGEIKLGPEIFEEVKQGNWRTHVKSHDLFAPHA